MKSRINEVCLAVVMGRHEVPIGLEGDIVKTLVLPYPIDAARFDALIVDATVGGAEIEFVYGAAAEKVNAFGGVGATLYYSGRSA